MSSPASPERLFLQKMKNVINKLEWESGHCLRLENGIEWGMKNRRSGLIEGATDELTEMQAEIIVDLQIAQRIAFEVAEYLKTGTEGRGVTSSRPQTISPLQPYLRRLDVFRSHVRTSLEEDIGKGLVIPGDKERICQKLKSYDEREAGRAQEVRGLI